MQPQICLASDNCTPAHPAILQALVEANKGYAIPYGGDPWTLQTEQLFCKVFKAPLKAMFVTTGTAANVIALKLACRRHESVICSDMAHLHTQESGSFESVVGCKLLTVPHQNGKITAHAVLHKLYAERALGKHATSPRVLSITQPTEIGTLYTLLELEELSKLCKQEKILMHIDASRLYNAAVSLNTPLDTIVHAAGVDIISLGGTKNGLMGAEAILIFNPQLQEGADHLHKQNLHLLSKMRYVSAQYLAFFQDDLWKKMAKHANDQAQKLAAIIEKIPSLFISYAVETNQVFFTAPASWIPRIQEEIFCYLWEKEKNELRFITSWNTTDLEIQQVKRILERLPQ